MPAAAALPLSTLATEFYNLSRPVGLVVALEQVQQLAVDACRFYAAYGRIKSVAIVAPVDTGDDQAVHTFTDIGEAGEPSPPGAPENSPTIVGSNIALSIGEWEIIRPLFVLYVERENALHLEATRGMGVDPYGRSVSEVTSDITLAEETVMARAFFFPIFTV